MRAKAGILIIISLLFLVGAVGALDASVINPPSKDWVIANGADQSTIIVSVQNTVGPIDGARVDFTVDNSIFGTMSLPTVITGPSGLATSTFTTNKKSGTAIINATISYNDGGSVIITKIVPQNIDHDILSPKFTPTTGTVGEVIPFIVTITDQWGNPIDNRRGDNTVSLYVTCPLPNECSFVGYNKSFSSQPDSNGNLTINTQLGIKTGLTTVTMDSITDPVKDIEEQDAYIDTVTSGPASLTAEISPPIVPPLLIHTVKVNDGIFYFTYTVSDKFGNPVKNQLINITTSLSETSSTTTNPSGKTPTQSYGPKSNVFSGININATAGNLTNQFTVAFATADPKDMVIYVVPQTMPSLDVDNSSKADVVARVLDNFGNPVGGQNISFTLSCSAPDPTSNGNPYLTILNGTTNSLGNMETTFIPGSFNSTADKDGSCILSTIWDDKPSYTPKTVTLTWMNYPYLSIYTSVSNQTVLLNDTFDVTIRVVGNGKPNTGSPVTVMMDMDASSNLANSGDRRPKALNASKRFVANLNLDDQLGLVSYGDIDNEVLHQTPTINHAIVQAAIDGVFGNMTGGVSGGGGNSISVKQSIDEAVIRIMNAPPYPVRAIISLGDSAYANDAELPGLVKETWTDNKIRVYTILYLSETGGGGCGAPTDSKAVRMRLLAEQTQGKFYWGCNEASIDAAYADITETLRKLAGENTNMSVVFTNISVNNSFMTGTEVYDYIPVGPFVNRTTDISQVNLSGRTSIIWTDLNQTVKDQSTEWPQLQFDIGNIEIGQTWSTTFRLKVKQLGLIKVFGDGSKISFNGGSGDLILPDLFINVKTNLTGQAFETGTLIVPGIQTVPPGSSFTDFVPLQWNTNYNSTISTNKATEYVYYKRNGGPWIQFDVMSAPTGDSTQSPSLDVRGLPWGKYSFWVHATAGDANEDNDYIFDIVVGVPKTSYIKLQ